MSIDPLKIIWQINLMEVKMLLKYLRKDIELVLNKQFFSENYHVVEFQEMKDCSEVSFLWRSKVSKIFANYNEDSKRRRWNESLFYYYRSDKKIKN